MEFLVERCHVSTRATHPHLDLGRFKQGYMSVIYFRKNRKSPGKDNGNL